MPTPPPPAPADGIPAPGTRRVEHVLRDETPHVLGTLVRRFGRFELAEDAVQEALLVASRRWGEEGPSAEHPLHVRAFPAGLRAPDDADTENVTNGVHRPPLRRSLWQDQTDAVDLAGVDVGGLLHTQHPCRMPS